MRYSLFIDNTTSMSGRRHEIASQLCKQLIRMVDVGDEVNIVAFGDQRQTFSVHNVTKEVRAQLPELLNQFGDPWGGYSPRKMWNEIEQAAEQADVTIFVTDDSFTSVSDKLMIINVDDVIRRRALP